MTTQLIHPNIPLYPKLPVVGQSRLVTYFGLTGCKPLPPPTLFQKGKGALKSDAKELPTGLIMHCDGTCYFRHDDRTIEERKHI